MGRGRRGRDEHAEYRLLAAAAVDGRLDPDSADALAQHLAQCEACRADQRAMLEDHAWLATPRRVAPPPSQVREAILDAARSPRVPRTRGVDRPWAALAAAALVVAVIGGGMLLSIRFGPLVGALPTGASSGAPPTAPAPSLTAAPTGPQAAPTDGIPFVRFTGQVTGRAETVGEVDLVVSVQGSGVQAQGDVQISRNGEEPWTGTITSATFWYGWYGPYEHWVAYIEGCRLGVNPCEQYRLQLLDAGTFGSDSDDVRFWMPAPGATEPPDATRVYQVVVGDVVVGGYMPRG
jgi:hypothetical protein